MTSSICWLMLTNFRYILYELADILLLYFSTCVRLETGYLRPSRLFWCELGVLEMSASEMSSM